MNQMKANMINHTKDNNQKADYLESSVRLRNAEAAYYGIVDVEKKRNKDVADKIIQSLGLQEKQEEIYKVLNIIE